MRVKRLSAAVSAALVLSGAAGIGFGAVRAAASSGPSNPTPGAQQAEVTSASHHDTSAPFGDEQPTGDSDHAHPAKHHGGNAPDSGQRAQDTSGRSSTPRVPATNANFDGIGANGSAPPDNDGAAGPTQYLEMVNSEIAVYSKTGSTILSPRATNTLFSGFGGGCQTNNDGDGTVLFDTMAQRWVVQQFSVTTTPYLDCVAISTTSDATGTWNRYSFQYANFPDYPKTGVWPDAYYASFNLFNAAGTQGLGTELCAFDRASMLTGAAATQQCFMATSSGESTLLPATLDGTTQPPAAEPEWFVGLSPNGGNALGYYKFHVSWTAPANSTLSAETDLAVTAFSRPCGGTGGTCVPQSGTTQQLDTLGDRLMYRLAYRNFGDHEAMVVDHSVTAGSSVGMRWYELRPIGSTLSVFQQGTYAPDSSYRWMGSIAIDKSGDMAMGYSVSSSSLHPGIRYTGRLVGDAAGSMPQGEATVITGAGSQSGSNLSRWGDYTEMTVDPADDCTFWYVNQYEAATGSFNWSTRIASFKFAGCGGVVSNDFSMSANPGSVSTTQGGSATSSISTTVTSGSAQSVTLSASGLPSGASASFNPASVTSGGSSTMTITTSPSTPAATSTVTVTGTGASATHTTTVSLTVSAQVVNDFSISASPSSVSVTQGGSGSSTISTAVTSGSAQSVTLSASGLPSGASASFNPASVTSGGSSTMTITTSASTPAATSTVTVTGTGTSATHTTAVSLTVSSAGGGSVVTNGGFETGTLSGWATGGALAPVVVASGAHTGTYAAQLGRNSPYNGDSTLTQTIAVPAGGGNLSFWYRPFCTDSITYDQQQAQLRSTGGTTLVTMLNACNNSGAWTQVTQSLAAYAGTSIVLWFNAHDDNYANPPDPTYMVLDDVAVTAPAPPPPNVITNGGFENGLSGWTATGSTAVHSGGHSGASSAQVGSTSPGTDSTLAQTVTIPAGGGTLTLWYQPHCPDTLTYDQEQVTLTDNTAGGSTTILNVCSNSGAWTQLTRSMSSYAGHSVTITLRNHDDNYPGDPTYTLVDDIGLG